MTIACIGWGSLIWKPENLPIRGPWFSDGPLLPLEFARQSKNGRITIVIVETAPIVRSLWVLMSTDDLSFSVRALRDREGILEKNVSKHIGQVTVTDNPGEKDRVSNSIKSWLYAQGLNAAIWTNLPPKFNNEEQKVPTNREVAEYLDQLEYSKKIAAEEYFRKAPTQIDTDIRRYVEMKLGWSPNPAKILLARDFIIPGGQSPHGFAHRQNSGAIII